MNIVYLCISSLSFSLILMNYILLLNSSYAYNFSCIGKGIKLANFQGEDVVTKAEHFAEFPPCTNYLLIWCGRYSHLVKLNHNFMIYSVFCSQQTDWRIIFISCILPNKPRNWFVIIAVHNSQSTHRQNLILFLCHFHSLFKKDISSWCTWRMCPTFLNNRLQFKIRRCFAFGSLFSLVCESVDQLNVSPAETYYSTVNIN